MSLQIYTPSSDRIIHNTRVDLTQRTTIQKPIHIMQYDNRLPIVAVELYKDGQPYSISGEYSVSVRWGRHMDVGCYEAVLGADAAYHTIYFEVTQPMAAIAGNSEFVIELLKGADSGATGPAPIDIHKNPVSEGDIERQPTYTAILEYVSIAEKAAERAESAGDGIEQYVVDAKSYADSAEASKIAAQATVSGVETIKSDTEALRDETRSIMNATSDIRDETAAIVADAKTARDEAKSFRDESHGYSDEAKGYSELANSLNAQTQGLVSQTSEVLEGVTQKLLDTEFVMDVKTGVLYYKEDSPFEFSVDENTGELLYRPKGD